MDFKNYIKKYLLENDSVKDTIRAEVTKKLGRPFSNNADWGSADVWPLSGDNFVGYFIYCGDEETLLLKRSLEDDGETYKDEELLTIESLEDLRKAWEMINKLNIGKKISI